MSIEVEIDDQKVEVTSFYFPASEPNIRINGKGNSAKIIVKEFHRDDLLNIFLIKDVLENACKIDNISLYLPYLPFSRQDRRCIPSECFGLSVLAKLLNDHSFKEIITFDVHSDKAKTLINNLKNIEPKKNVVDIIVKNKIDLIIFPDDGALKRYRDLYSTHSIAAKKNRDPNTGHIVNYEINSELVSGKNCLVVDDICDGGMTFIKLGEAINGKSENIFLYVSHGIFSKGIDVLKPYYNHIFTTDSIYKEEENNEYITVYRCV